MDRFASGQTTNKFEVPLPSDIRERITGIQADYTKDIKDLENDIDSRFDQLSCDMQGMFHRIDSRITPICKWYDQFGSDVGYHDSQFTNLIKLAVSNPIIRFLNFHIFHWFTISIVENRFPLFGQHDKYMAYIGFMNPEQFIDDYGYDTYKQEMHEAFKRSHRVMKTHLKKIKSEGYNLSNMRFRF